MGGFIRGSTYLLQYKELVSLQSKLDLMSHKDHQTVSKKTLNTSEDGVLFGMDTVCVCEKIENPYSSNRYLPTTASTALRGSSRMIISASW